MDVGGGLRFRDMGEKDECIENFSYRINDLGKLIFMLNVVGNILSIWCLLWVNIIFFY